MSFTDKVFKINDLVVIIDPSGLFEGARGEVVGNASDFPVLLSRPLQHPSFAGWRAMSLHGSMLRPISTED